MIGSGLLQGLKVTAKNLVGSFHDPARFTTVEYPEQKTALPENYRNFPFLVSETAEDPMGTLRCVACQICEKECPPQCIYIEKSKDKKPDATGKMQVYPAIFAIDTSVCMSCQICVEVCPFDAIKMDQVFEIATSDRFTGLLLNREQLAKSNAYYHQIHPTEAADVDKVLEAARKKAEEDKAKVAAAAAAKAAAPKPASGTGPKTEAPPSAGTPAKDTTTPPPSGSGSTPNTAAAKPATAAQPAPASLSPSSVQPPAAPSAEAPKPPPAG